MIDEGRDLKSSSSEIQDGSVGVIGNGVNGKNDGTTKMMKHAVSGAIAGTVATVLMHPLDVLKTRLQVQDNIGGRTYHYRNTAHAFRTVLRAEGWMALFQGLTPSFIGATVSWGLYFYWYNICKSEIEVFVARRDPKSPPAHLGPLAHLAAAAQAGVVCCLLTNPIWLVKTRLELQQNLGGARSPDPYRGFIHALSTIAAHEGLRGLYRGLGPSLLLVSHGAIQFSAYERIKSLMLSVRRPSNHHPDPPQMSTVECMATAAASKLIATTATYPYQVVRSRIQQRDPCGADSTSQVVRNLIRVNGWRGLYKGLGANTLKVVPSAVLTFVVYEHVQSLLTTRHL